jgi:hypothetical protein
VGAGGGADTKGAGVITLLLLDAEDEAGTPKKPLEGPIDGPPTPKPPRDEDEVVDDDADDAASVAAT